MRRLAGAFLVAAAFGGPGAVGAQEHEPAAGHEAGAHESGGEEAACTASSDDEQCLEYWEHHINWWSWDYRGGADQASEHRHMPAPFGFALINFAIFATIMYRLAGGPLKDFVRTRHTTIKKDIDEAAALHREAEAKLKEYESKIAGLDQEIASLLAQVRAEAEAEKARIIAGAEQQAERLKAEAQLQIANEVQRVRRELRAEVVAAAVAVAERLVAEKASAEDQARLAERFVSDLEGPKRAAGVRS